jgi:hypothetical protein
MKKCGRCKEIKEDDQFSPSQLKSNSSICRPCATEKARIYKDKHIEQYQEYEKERWQKEKEERIETPLQKLRRENKEQRIATNQKPIDWNNREERLAYSRQYNEEHREKWREEAKIYRQEHKEEIRQAKKLDRQRPQQKIRHTISGTIRRALYAEGSSKNSESINNHLEYTMDELKQHIESLFEPWMTWENYGVYKPTEWNDEDQSTWKWQIDHEKPHSEFHYTSMEDQTFKDCWALKNLRPLSAKDNVIEGVRRTRHSKDQ